MKFRVLVIGTGFGAAVHIPALQGMADVATASLVSGRSGEWRALVAAGDCDLAVVAVPPVAQISIAETVLKAGIPVLIEKPGGLDAASLARLGQFSPPVAIGYSFRFARGLTQLIEQVMLGAIGDIRDVSVDWMTSGWASPSRPWSWRCDQRAGGGALRDMACHSLDYLRLILRRDFTTVTARIKTGTPARRDTDGQLKPVDAPEQVELVLDAQDATARISIANNMPQGQGHRIEVHGTHGRLTWNHPAPFTLNTEELTLVRTDGSTAVIPLDSDVQQQADTRISAGRRQLMSFLRICGVQPALQSAVSTASVEDACAVLDLIAAAEVSANENRRIALSA